MLCTKVEDIDWHSCIFEVRIFVFFLVGIKLAVVVKHKELRSRLRGRESGFKKVLEE